MRLPLLLALLALWMTSDAQERYVPLDDDWSFQAPDGNWYSAEVPGVVHTDLLRHGLIPDPYRNSNADSVQWIEDSDWTYERTLYADLEMLANEHVDLLFEGLDTFADVYLNDSLIGSSDNMFRQWEWPIRYRLQAGANRLRVVLRSPVREGAAIRDAYGIQLPHDSDPSGVAPFVRKAAYHFGWDFCPRLVTSGIWKPVRIRCWNEARLDEVRLVHEIGPKNMDLLLEAWTGDKEGLTLRWTMDGELIAEKPMDLIVDGARGCRLPHTVSLEGIWQPVGRGKQRLHRVLVELLDPAGTVLSTEQFETGFRTVELLRTPDQDGTAFTIAVNGRELFMKGCNLVPPDMFLPRAGDNAWTDLVVRMQEAHMNMARIWAGGVYPPEAFFHACDTAGILIWQDLMFANIPPDTGPAYHSARTEVLEQVSRLERHPSVALICGNNELQVAWNNWGWQDRYGIHGTDSIRVAKGLDRFFNEETSWLVQGSGIPYTPTSPLSNWGNEEGLRNGDLHYWGVWHGDSTFASYGRNVGRFVSEYGFQSYPDSALLARYNDPDELVLGSETLRRMQRSYRTDMPIWRAIRDELGRKPESSGGFIEASQAAQAKAMGIAVQAHIAAYPRCMGSLVWQLNDPWPGPSWSLIDHSGRPKPAFEVVKEAYRNAP